MTSALKLRSKGSVRDPDYVREVTIEDLRGRELFKEVPDTQLGQILNSSRICGLNANERLSPTRGQVDHVYVILKGYVAIWMGSCFNPLKETFLAWRGPNQIIGEMRPIGAKPSPARITTCDPCELLEMRSDTFLDVAKINPLIYRNIANLLLKKMTFERHRSEVIQTSLSERRVAQTLIHLAEDRCGQDQLNKPNRLQIPGTIHQDELAAYAGLNRATVNRHLVRFKKEQIIAYKSSKSGNQMIILNQEELKMIVNKPARPDATGITKKIN